MSRTSKEARSRVSPPGPSAESVRRCSISARMFCCCENCESWLVLNISLHASHTNTNTLLEHFTEVTHATEAEVVDVVSECTWFVVLSNDMSHDETHIFN